MRMICSNVHLLPVGRRSAVRQEPGDRQHDGREEGQPEMDGGASITKPDSTTITAAALETDIIETRVSPHGAPR